MEEWKTDKYAPVIKQKMIVVSHEDQYIQYTSTPQGNVEYGDEARNACSHIEADTKLVYHLYRTVNSKPESECCCPCNGH